MRAAAVSSAIYYSPCCPLWRNTAAGWRPCRADHYRRHPRQGRSARVLSAPYWDKLIPFEIYPETCPTTIKELFREYDERFAEALRIPLRGDYEYEIEHVLSHDWWDDGAWDLGAEES
jgi:hypothetical protein